MELTPIITRGVIVSTKHVQANSSSSSSDVISKLEPILLRQAGAYYSDISHRGKIFGILGQRSASSHYICISIESVDNNQVSLQTYVTTFNPSRKLITNSYQECSSFIQDLHKSKFCHGMKEDELLPYLNNYDQASFFTAVFLIERVEEEVVYRSRKCKYFVDDDELNQCKFCRELFENIINTKEDNQEEQTSTVHEDNSDTNTNQKYPFCDIVFQKENHSKLKSHVKKHHRDMKDTAAWRNVVSGDKVQITCSVCGKNYSSLSSLEQHFKLMHSEQVEMESCHICGKVFKKGGSTLWGHMKTHQDGGHICSVCGAKFKVKSYLQRHMRSHDPERKKYGCDICGEKFTRPYLMRQHQEFTHNKNLPFKCGQCGKKLRSNTFLKIHMRSVHSKEKPFPCEVCGFCSSRVDNLNIHRTKVHNLPNRITRTELQRLVSEGKHPYCSNPDDIPQF